MGWGGAPFVFMASGGCLRASLCACQGLRVTGHITVTTRLKASLGTQAVLMESFPTRDSAFTATADWTKWATNPNWVSCMVHPGRWNWVRQAESVTWLSELGGDKVLRHRAWGGLR